MQDFVELKGASGRGYRFRVVRTGETPLPMAGNYAIVNWQAGRCSVVRLGMTNDLSKVHDDAPPRDRELVQTYIRLNVARSAREAEHEDLAAAYQGTKRIAAE